MPYGLTKSPLIVAATPSLLHTATSIAVLDITGDVTVEAWVKFTSMPADRANIVSKPNAAKSGYSNYSLEVLKTGANYDLRLVVSVAATPFQAVIKTSWNPNLSQWYHVAATRISATGACEIVIDGVSAATATTTTGATDSSTSPLTIGNFAPDTTNLPLDGRVSLVRVWNVQRSAATINTNKCNVYGTATTNMQGEWSLDNVLTDASGNGSTLTNVGSVLFATDTPSTCAAAPAISRPISNMLLMGV